MGKDRVAYFYDSASSCVAVTSLHLGLCLMHPATSAQALPQRVVMVLLTYPAEGAVSIANHLGHASHRPLTLSMCACSKQLCHLLPLLWQARP